MVDIHGDGINFEGGTITGGRIKDAMRGKRSILSYGFRLQTVIWIVVVLVGFMSCNHTDEPVVARQVTCIHTNTYLVIDVDSREAAIIDVAGPIDSLLAIVVDQNLDMKYFLFTHGHFDHVMGLPKVKGRFPDALVGMTKHAFEDMQVQLEYGISTHGEEWLELMRQDRGTAAMLEFDPLEFGAVDLYLTDDQILRLGDRTIRVLHTPGHSRGHVCFGLDDRLFSGDLLFHRSAGHTGWLGGSEDDLMASLCRVYREFSRETIVYPGHDQYTTIGSELENNERATLSDCNGTASTRKSTE
jgi:glyoxylase-like metal-dependent hydrolase (beta-lactamase superfamily II)